MRVKLRLTGKQYGLLQAHLFPGDGKEAVALALCGRNAGPDVHCLSIHRIEVVPYAECSVRAPDRLVWRTDRVRSLLDEAARRGLAILKIHSHPNGFEDFSMTDTVSDKELFESISSWLDAPLPHASAVMLPNGRIFGRVYYGDGAIMEVDIVAVAGEQLLFFHRLPDELEHLPGFTKRHAQAFGKGTTRRLRRLTIAVIGCSGTGSIVLEQLARLGVGRLVLVDPEPIEDLNLNRILNARKRDARAVRSKVDVQADAITEAELDCEVVRLRKSVCDPEVVKAVAECDVVFGCMDGAEGRHLVNRLAAFYLVPYFDVGVRLEADGEGGIDQICGQVNYLQPDGSSLLSRKVITMKQVEAEGLKRTNPTEYVAQVRAKYIRGVEEDRPAVISVNMHYASLCVLEFLARLHPYRDDGNTGFAQFGSSLTQVRFVQTEDGTACKVLARHVGRGDVLPLLEMSSLSPVGT